MRKMYISEKPTVGPFDSVQICNNEKKLEELINNIRAFFSKR